MKIVKYFLILIGMTLLLLSGCKGKLTGYTKIDYNDFENNKNNKEDFALVLGSSTCSACALYQPIMEEFITKYQIEVFYIDLSKVTEDEYNKLKSEINFDGTPTTVFYKNGKMTSYYDRLDGAENIVTVTNKFKEMGMLKE